MASQPHSIPNPTYVDKFGLHLASRLIGRDKLILQLKQAAAEVTSSSSSPECRLGPSTSASPRLHRKRCSGKPSENSSAKSIRLYWRTPLLHHSFGRNVDINEGSEVKDDRSHGANEKVIFIDVTFEFLLPKVSSPTFRNNASITTSSSSSSSDHSIWPPRVQVQFGALIQKNSQSPSGQKSLEEGDHIFNNTAEYIRGAPITHSDLILHAQQVGIDLEGTTPYALANLMAGTLVCSNSHRAFVISENDTVDQRGKAAMKCHDIFSKEEECTVKLLLSYDDLGGEEGELLIHPTLSNGSQKDQANKKDVGFIGGLALDMLLTNLERQDDGFDSNVLRSCNSHHHRQQDDSGDEADENIGSQNDDNCAAVEQVFQSWWENAYDEIVRRYERNDPSMNGPISKSLEANFSGRASSNSAFSSPQRAKKALDKAKTILGTGNTLIKTINDSLQSSQSCANSHDKNTQPSRSSAREPLHEDGSKTAGPLSIDTADGTGTITATSSTITNCNPSQNYSEEVNSGDCTYETPFSLTASLPPISPPMKTNGHKRRKTAASRQRGRGVLVLGNPTKGGRVGGSKRKKRGRITIGG